MIRKKVAMVGAFAVGKTSLVQRFVSGIFSDRYLTTVGVRIDKKDLEVDGRLLSLILWDLQGEDELHTVRMTHLRGSAGLLFVADGTRASTLDTALRLAAEAVAQCGVLPSLLLINKCDVRDRWEVTDARLDELRAGGWQLLETSAQSGLQVEAAFAALGRAMLRG
ncbi:MAG: GTP-binding protein [Planctomycetes bacterium]|nr:GTP-binding protein [Planctomycetota bacterium]